MLIELPAFCLVLLIGAACAGKTTFVQRNFQSTEVISIDALQRAIGDDETDRTAGDDALDLLHRIAAMRLKRGLLTVVDAAALHPDQRRPLLRIARDLYAQPVAIVFDSPEDLSQSRAQANPDGVHPPEGIHRRIQPVERSLEKIRNEGIGSVFRFASVEEMDHAVVRRVSLAVDLRQRRGPFDIIGDVHGCADELEELLTLLGYTKIAAGFSSAHTVVNPGAPLPSSDPVACSPYPFRYTHPAGRTAVFVGDLVDRGPRILDACMLALHAHAAGDALVVPGNHDDKFLRWLKSHSVEIAHGLQHTVAEIEALPPAAQPALQVALLRFFDALPSHLLLDGGNLAVAHAGVRQRMLGRDTKRVRDFTLYGETHGETDQAGRPVRYNWAADYHGEARIVYGHTPIATPQWQNQAINIDTGCVYGGRLTALRYPELELISVPARRVYYAPR